MLAKRSEIWLVAAVCLMILLGSCAANDKTSGSADKNTSADPDPSDSPVYAPKIDAKSFTGNAANKYFTLKKGTKLVYEGMTAEGLERTEIEVTGETREVMGVTTLVYRDRVFIGGELVEDTRDWLALDKDGNVWYFGEDVDNYEDGKLADHEGSWEAGVDGAQPGIWIKNGPKKGDSYRNEYYKGHAEDMTDILETGIEVSTELRTYKDCVKTLDYTPLEPDVKEHKYYCSDVAAMVLEEDQNTKERSELISIETP